MPQHNEFEKLIGIIEEFDQHVVKQVLDNFTLEKSRRILYKEFPDPGPEVKAGAEECVQDLPEGHPERIILENNLLPVHFLEEGAVVQGAVARVRVPGKWVGTGFMVSPTLLMTNNHVLPDRDTAKTAKIEFNYQTDYMGSAQTVDTYSTDPPGAFHTNQTLDYTLVRLKPHYRRFSPHIHARRLAGREQAIAVQQQAEWAPQPDDPETLHERVIGGYHLHDPLKTARLFSIPTHAGNKWSHLRLLGAIQYHPPQNNLPGQHINIIQHPSGRRKEVAVQRNNLDHVYTNRVRYTTDTEPGSSGSPVFNNGWDLIAIHHAAGDFQNGAWVNNEGVRVDKIVSDLQQYYDGTPTGQAILNELGI